ncbi:MAG: FAD-binding domain-containing protein [Rubrivivax sp.]
MNPVEATRARAWARLEAFVPRMGRHYAQGRNHDPGPQARGDVSGLSPWIRRRLVLEQEVVAAALAAHGPEVAAKFIEEVFWRGYFKGWLEQRPAVWVQYREGLTQDLQALEQDAFLRRRVEAARSGRTGLACFDAWVQELQDTGHLHNHARMWFASIWIFTLGLPWRLGADLFLRHLLDGDPASNTLGWRWVAGLHTRGKPYVAQAWNIARYTGQRFTPTESELASAVTPLDGQEPQGWPPAVALHAPLPPEPGVPTALLLTEEDCRPEDFDLAGLDLRGMLAVRASALRSPLAVAQAVSDFEGAALEDTVARVQAHLHARHAGLARQPQEASTPSGPTSGVPMPVASDPDDLARWAVRLGVRQVATAFVPQGPLRAWLDRAECGLQAHGIALRQWHRDWDAAVWPHAGAGFFKVRQRIPRILQDLGLLDR